MLKKINWRSIFYGFLWLISLSGLITLMSFIEIKKSSLKCKDVKVLLPGQFNFIERNEVDRILMANAGAMVGRDLNEINIHKLENALKANPFIILSSEISKNFSFISKECLKSLFKKYVTA